MLSLLYLLSLHNWRKLRHKMCYRQGESDLSVGETEFIRVTITQLLIKWLFTAITSILCSTPCLMNFEIILKKFKSPTSIILLWHLYLVAWNFTPILLFSPGISSSLILLINMTLLSGSACSAVLDFTGANLKTQTPPLSDKATTA